MINKKTQKQASINFMNYPESEKFEQLKEKYALLQKKFHQLANQHRQLKQNLKKQAQSHNHKRTSAMQNHDLYRSFRFNAGEKRYQMQQNECERCHRRFVYWTELFKHKKKCCADLIDGYRHEKRSWRFSIGRRMSVSSLMSSSNNSASLPFFSARESTTRNETCSSSVYDKIQMDTYTSGDDDVSNTLAFNPFPVMHASWNLSSILDSTISMSDSTQLQNQNHRHCVAKQIYVDNEVVRSTNNDAHLLSIIDNSIVDKSLRQKEKNASSQPNDLQENVLHDDNTESGINCVASIDVSMPCVPEQHHISAAILQNVNLSAINIQHNCPSNAQFDLLHHSQSYDSVSTKSDEIAETSNGQIFHSSFVPHNSGRASYVQGHGDFNEIFSFFMNMYNNCSARVFSIEDFLPIDVQTDVHVPTMNGICDCCMCKAREQNRGACTLTENECITRGPTYRYCRRNEPLSTKRYKRPSSKNDACGECLQSLVDRSRKIKRRRIVCFICVKQLSSAASLKKHYLIHMDVKNYACAMCDRTFRQLQSLKKHERTHLYD